MYCGSFRTWRPLPGCRLRTSCYVLTWWEGLGNSVGCFVFFLNKSANSIHEHSNYCWRFLTLLKKQSLYPLSLNIGSGNAWELKYGRSEIGPISGFRPQETGSFYFLSLEILILGMQPPCVRKPADPRRGTCGKTLVSCSWQPAPICQSCEWASWKWVFQPHSSCPMWKRDESSLQSSAQIVHLWVNKWLLLMQATKFCFVLVLVVVGVTKQKITLTSISTKMVCNKPPKTSWASNSSPLFSQIFSSPTPAPLHVHSFWGTSMRVYTPWDKLFSWNGRVIRGQARHTRLLKVQAQNQSLLFLPTCLCSNQVT